MGDLMVWGVWDLALTLAALFSNSEKNESLRLPYSGGIVNFFLF